MAASQNQTSKWYFGLNAGLDFATNPPTILTNGAFTSYEGGASMSDASGNLLFYTNANTIWDQTHSPMANGTGIMGGQSSVQSSIIVKQPGSANIYIVFTQESQNQINGFRYSVVDMSLAAGMGSVTTKNVLLQTPSSERLAAVKHCNGTDFWIITHDMNSDVFRNFLVTSAGVNPVPVTSSVGSVVNGNGFIGAVKVSHNGKKIGMTVFLNGTGNCQLFDFDNSTGLVSNPLMLNNNVNNAYGLEFSPDNSKLYAATFGAGTTIFQWDVCAGSNAAIVASQFTMPTNMVNACGSFQLAPNGKIYISFHNIHNLGVIRNPDLSGAACNYTNAGQSVGTGTTQLGLPNFVSSYFTATQPPFTFSVTNNCTVANFSVPISVQCQAVSNYTGFAWNFGDPSSGPDNTSVTSPVSHTFSAPGTYTIQLVMYSPCGSDTINQVINAGNPVISVSGNSIICPGQTASLTASGATTYTWSTGANTNSVNVNPSANTIYTVSGTDANGCSNTTSVAVNIVTSNPITTFSYNAPVCMGDTVIFADTASGFFFGGTFSSPGLNVNAGTGQINLSAVSAGTYVVTYSVPITGCFGPGSSTAGIVIIAPANIGVSPSATIEPGGSITLNASGGVNYTWTPSAGLSCTDCPAPVASPADNIMYCVTSIVNSCVSKACTDIKISCENNSDYSVPNAFTPNGDGNNDAFCLQGWKVCLKNFSVIIFDRWGEKVYESNNPSFCWDGIYNGKLLSSDVYVYTIKAVKLDGTILNKKGNITLVR